MVVRIIKTATASVRVYSTAQEVALKAARSFARLADQYVLGCGRFSVALSGGSTPKAMFSILAEEPFLGTVPWTSIYFFWGDERMVPRDHVDSNYRSAYETLFSRVPVLSENIFGIPTDDLEPEAAAAAYSETTARVLGASDGFPILDLVFLGMGADGHTASLFPYTSALTVDDRIAVANPVETLKTTRITLTVPVINSARNIRFLVSGADKAEALKAVLEGPRDTQRLPSQLIQPKDGNLVWMIDQDASRLLAAV